MIFVDDVFAEAKVRLEEMAKTAKAAYYEDIFDERLERLRALGCPAFILNKLKAKKGGSCLKGMRIEYTRKQRFPDSRYPQSLSDYLFTARNDQF